ncbi:MAG TPA: ornithine carbamoyltransferase [Gammaproteobacteria bacterium]|nr:ornithine carbamoyltransferase [Gammaproteobacteria bacterium]
MKHFLTLDDMTPSQLQQLLSRAIELKAMQQRGELYRPFIGKTQVLIFTKASTRTRVSFETGFGQFGGTTIFLAPDHSQLGRGEPAADTARVLSRMADIVVIRTAEHNQLLDFANHATIPVVNALTDDFHPCQLLADIMTYEEHRGSIRGRRVTWIGDGNNMCHSWMNAARLFDFELSIATPAGYAPKPALTQRDPGRFIFSQDPDQAILNSDLVVTDTWASMGQEEEKARRQLAFSHFKVTKARMSKAKPEALFMHCLPAYRGFEVDAAVIDGPQSVVWDEAGNRLHAQKALLEYLLDGFIGLSENSLPEPLSESP